MLVMERMQEHEQHMYNPLRAPQSKTMLARKMEHSHALLVKVPARPLSSKERIRIHALQVFELLAHSQHSLSLV